MSSVSNSVSAESSSFKLAEEAMTAVEEGLLQECGDDADVVVSFEFEFTFAFLERLRWMIGFFLLLFPFDGVNESHPLHHRHRCSDPIQGPRIPISSFSFRRFWAIVVRNFYKDWSF